MTPTDELLDDATRQATRRLQRARARCEGDVKPALNLPELDALDLPLLLPGQAVASPPFGMFDGAAMWYRPDGTPITGQFPETAGEAESLLRSDRTVALTSLFRAGTRLMVSTVFLVLDHRMGGGPPILWETMVFHGGTRGWGDGRECWRYASREAALAGHRRVVVTLREVRSLRRMADGPRRHLARVCRPLRLARMRAAYGAAW